MMRTLLFLIATSACQPALAASLRVPQDHKTIQAAIDASQSGDTISVAPGKYQERVRLKPGITLRSDGNDAKGADGLKRAEATIIDGGGKEGKTPGVVMAEGSTLDGFTITNVGAYDESLWKKHFDSQGEELGDEDGSVQAEGTIPAISVRGVNCTVTRCIVRHNGDVGIGVVGNEKTKTAPLVADNLVYRNMGGGIGVAEGAEPIIRGNICRRTCGPGSVAARRTRSSPTTSASRTSGRASAVGKGQSPSSEATSATRTAVPGSAFGWKARPRWSSPTSATRTRWPESGAGTGPARSCATTSAARTRWPGSGVGTGPSRSSSATTAGRTIWSASGFRPRRGDHSRRTNASGTNWSPSA